MKFSQLLSIELLKTKRPKIFPILLIMPLLGIASSIATVTQRITPGESNVWQTMFSHSSLGFGLYLLPFCMITVCAMLSGREMKDNGMIKMLSLPISRAKLALAKFVVLLCYLAMEIVIFTIVFMISGLITTAQMTNVMHSMPIAYILKWSACLFVSSLPSLSLMWLFTIVFEKPVLSIGLNIILIIPSIVIVTTQYWALYPHSYSAYLMACELNRLYEGATNIVLDISIFLPCAVSIFAIALIVSIIQFGKREMK